MQYKQITFSVEADGQEHLQPLLQIYDQTDPDKRVLKARLDKWLWAARFFKTRALARAAVEEGRVMYEGQLATPGREISVGAKIVISQARHQRTIIIKRLSTRRHNNDEANALYEDTGNTCTYTNQDSSK